jgi:tellurite methyltransferase
MKLSLFLIFMFEIGSAWAKTPISAERLNKLSGERQSGFDTKSEWDMKYSRPSFIFGKTPAKFLAENFDYIKEGSTVLDMGMGEGRNAVFLAQKGHKVTGVDISSVAIKKSYMLAKEFDVKIKGVVASLESYQIPDESFDAIICFYYVDRNLISKMRQWLKPGGVIIYEAYTLKQKTKKDHHKDPDSYYLKEQELLTLFKGMKVLKYEEPLHEKNSRASIILQKKDK